MKSLTLCKGTKIPLTGGESIIFIIYEPKMQFPIILIMGICVKIPA